MVAFVHPVRAGLSASWDAKGSGWNTVYVVVTDDTGTLIAQRYIEDGNRLALWLTISGHHGARCAVYDNAPALGGQRLQTLVRDGSRWVEGIPSDAPTGPDAPTRQPGANAR